MAVKKKKEKKKSFISFTSKVKVSAAIVDYTAGLLLLLRLYTAQAAKVRELCTINSGLC